MGMLRNRDPEGCGACLKVLVIITNLLFFGCACAVIGVGIWILSERNFMSIVFGSTLLTASIILCIAGCCFLTVIITVFGCCGVLKENPCMIMTYFILLLLAFLTLIIAGILAVVFRTQIGEEVKTYMEESIREDYGINPDYVYNRLITDAWDKTQNKLQCCAVDERGWSIYRQSDWFKEQPSDGPDGAKPYVPKSCCKSTTEPKLSQCQYNRDGPPGSDYNLPNNALHYQGCYEEGLHWAMDHSRYFIGIGLGIGLFLIFAMIFSILLYRNITPEKMV